MAAWQVRPPRLVTMAAAASLSAPIGIGHDATSTSPVRNDVLIMGVAQLAPGPSTDPLADGQAADERFALALRAGKPP